MGGMGTTKGKNGRVYTNSYPDDQTLIRMAEDAPSMTGLARALGVRRESLRDYLVRRPDLNRAVREAAIRPKLTPEQAKANMSESRAKWRAKNMDTVREINRRWARNQSPEKRHRWNSYNRERRKTADPAPMDDETAEYLRIIQGDPCVYCGTPGEETDHIQSIYLGGTTTWSNLARACRSCNRSKSKRTLLAFLLARR